MSTELQARKQYARVPTDAPAEEPPFEVGQWAVFCFRRPDDRTQSNCLNLCATMLTFYLHCEICVLNRDNTDARTLFITSESGRVTFARVRYVRADAPTPWLFLWARLSDGQRANMQICMESMSGDAAKVFSPWRIFCFHCACCFGAATTTCSETTMEVIDRIWHLRPVDAKFYSPDNVYAFVNRHRAELGIVEQMTGRAPDTVIVGASRKNVSNA